MLSEISAEMSPRKTDCHERFTRSHLENAFASFRARACVRGIPAEQSEAEHPFSSANIAWSRLERSDLLAISNSKSKMVNSENQEDE